VYSQCRVAQAVRAEAIAVARELNRGELGRSLSEQSWGICRKIREVDDLLLGKPGPRAEVREVHPEVCFWALAGRSPMKHNKKHKEGLGERLAVLQHLSQTPRASSISCWWKNLEGTYLPMMFLTRSLRS
jgi:predicted RNase H-like nuclease